MCDRWLEPRGKGFRNFLADMGERPQGYSLDRIDNNGMYEPSNCKWSSKHTQMANRRVSNEVVGISWMKSNKLWVASFGINNKMYQKYFKSKEEAIAHRKMMEEKYLAKEEQQ